MRERGPGATLPAREASETVPVRGERLPRLRFWRLRRALSQRGLAEVSNVSLTSISRIELGERAQASTIRRLADALKVEPAELMEPDPPQPAG